MNATYWLSFIIIMEICKAPILRLKALNKHTHIMDGKWYAIFLYIWDWMRSSQPTATLKMKCGCLDGRSDHACKFTHQQTAVRESCHCFLLLFLDSREMTHHYPPPFSPKCLLQRGVCQPPPRTHPTPFLPSIYCHVMFATPPPPPAFVAQGQWSLSVFTYITPHHCNANCMEAVMSSFSSLHLPPSTLKSLLLGSRVSAPPPPPSPPLPSG